MTRSVICLISSVLLLLLGLLYWQSPLKQSYTQEVLRWNNGDVALEGTLYLPKSEGPHPCAVFVHGSGTLARSGRSGKMYREHAERLSAHGLAVLIYDKRGCGKSTGDWRKATFDDLCQDALGAVANLRKRPDIDASKIGLFGCSQGGWIVLLAASKDPQIAFLVTLSGPTVTPAEQGHYIVEAQMRKDLQPEGDIRSALELDRQITEVYRTDTGWEVAEEAIREVEREAWFEHAGIGLQRKAYWNWQWYRDLPFDFDPLPLLKSLDVPLFAVHGENDMLVSAEQSAATINQLATEGRPFATIVFPKCRHAVDIGISKTWTAPKEYWTKLNQWLVGQNILQR